MPLGSGAIGAALGTGDQGHISPADAQAMRDSGLAHLLSISGLHLTAVVGFIFIAVSRLLSLSSWLALRISIPIVAAATAALAALAYTLLTGAEVPTVRSFIAAALILIALALGRGAHAATGGIWCINRADILARGHTWAEFSTQLCGSCDHRRPA